MVTTNGEREGDLSSDPKGVHPKMWRKGKALCTVGGNVHGFSHYGKQFGDPTRYFLKKNKKKKKKHLAHLGAPLYTLNLAQTD